MERNEFVYRLYNQAIRKAAENSYELSPVQQDELIALIRQGVSRLSYSDFTSLAKRQIVQTNLERLVESVTHEAVMTVPHNHLNFSEIGRHIRVWPFYCLDE